ncbi:MAG: hypothetical protein RLZZ314_547 [Bacteroidota bacterium]
MSRFARFHVNRARGLGAVLCSMRIALALWLVLATCAELVVGFFTFVALGMSAMIFTSPEVLGDPKAWGLIGSFVVALGVLGVGLVLQWLFFALKKPVAAVVFSVAPFVVVSALAGMQHRILTEASAPSPSNFVPNRPYTVVKFQLHAPGLPPDSAVFIAGSPAGWGPWLPDGLRMEYIGGQTWEKSAWVEGSTLEFKYTLGTWDHEALDRDGFKRSNATISLNCDTLLVDTVTAWSSSESQQRVVGQITGRLDSLGTFMPPGLLPRSVWLWWPPETEPPTPVSRLVVMHDGQNVVNPATANFGVDWGVDEVLDGLVREGAMPRTAVLAVACTDDRSSDYGPGPAGVTYVAWLAEELVPFVQSSQGMAQDLPVTVAGASMGGLISFIAAERHPDVFASAMCMSPAFAYNGFSYVDSLRARSWSGNRVPMWIDNGTVGLETQLQTGVDDMGAYLDSLQQTFTVRSYHGARHFESDWGARFGEALLWLTTHEPAHHEGRQSAP